MKVTTVRPHAGSHFHASSNPFSSVSCSLLSGRTSHEQCPTRTIERQAEFAARNFFVFFFDRMNTADTLGWEIKNGWSCLGFTEMWNMALASAAAYRNINQCHVMNHANAPGPFHSQFMSPHGLSEVGLLSARHLRQGFWGSLIPR